MAARLKALYERHPSLPLALLVALCLASLGIRAAWLGDPCRSPCRTAADHVLVFDESYYVNAARVIAGIHPPTGSTYAAAPLGVDPNAEHPQLAKLVIAGAIELFGDGAFAWRLGSLLFGTLAIAGMFALVRAAGGGPWVALGAAGLMAADNLLIVHGRIGTLDIYALAAMVWGVALYLRNRPLIAGVVLGAGACMKLVSAYALLVLVFLEVLRWLASRQAVARRLARLAEVAAAGVASFFGLLAILDRIAKPYDYTAGKPVAAGPFAHFGHMLSYAANQTSPHGPTGIASYPFGWLVDYKPIVYLNVNPARPTGGLVGIHPAVHFLGLISPPVLLVGVPALVAAAAVALRRPRAIDRDVAVLAVSWFLGTFIPFLLLSVVWQRTSYIYYMVVVMPGLYVAAAWAVAWLHRRPRPTRVWVGTGIWVGAGIWVATVVAAAVIAYPLTPLP
jgi:predicted membrane-bound dolichyl-phosphate-mannose-protein mannosyltransferase